MPPTHKRQIVADIELQCGRVAILFWAVIQYSMYMGFGMSVSLAIITIHGTGHHQQLSIDDALCATLVSVSMPDCPRMEIS
jgi:hypothetical protein